MRRTGMIVVLVGVVFGTVGCQGFGIVPPLAQGRLVESKDVVNAVPRAGGPIKVDGSLDETAWAKATAMTDFVLGPSGKPEVQSRVLVTYDDENLYVAVINEEPNIDRLVTNATERDGNVWSDDSVEIYIDAANEKGGNYHGFFVSASNVVYDRQQVEDWNGEWTSAIGRFGPTVWLVEVAISFKTIGVTPKPGHKFGLMVARNRRAGLDQPQGLYLVPCNDEAKDTSLYPVLELR